MTQIYRVELGNDLMTFSPCVNVSMSIPLSPAFMEPGYITDPANEKELVRIIGEAVVKALKERK